MNCKVDMQVSEVIDQLKILGSQHHKNQFSRFGIQVTEAYGVSSAKLKILAKTIGKDHNLALDLYPQNLHEAKLICAFIADPLALSKETMNEWTSGIYSWDLCDNLCMHLFRKSPLAKEMALCWIKNDREFVRRCGLVVMVSLSIHQKKASNDELFAFSEIALNYVMDDRNFVKKAISWLFRQQGKRNLEMRNRILKLCVITENQNPDSKSARWIVSDVRRELNKPTVLERLRSKPSDL